MIITRKAQAIQLKNGLITHLNIIMTINPNREKFKFKNPNKGVIPWWYPSKRKAYVPLFPKRRPVFAGVRVHLQATSQ